jgi:hypothetical protein
LEVVGSSPTSPIMDINSVEVKVGEGLSLKKGDVLMISSTMSTDDTGALVSRESGLAYIEREGCLQVYPDWEHPFVD